SFYGGCLVTVSGVCTRVVVLNNQTVGPEVLARHQKLTYDLLKGSVNNKTDFVETVAMPKVAILLCTYNGQRYLAEQLSSFVAQSHGNWEVWASDDGSKDDTQVILEAIQQKWPDGRLSIHVGPAKGFVANFLSLTCDASIDADYYAYSDQDDIWEPNKLARAVEWLKSIPESIPALYCSRTRIVDANNNEIGLSPLFCKPPSFANALMQNIGGGNTMVFNTAARNLLREAGENLSLISHDWWVYIVVTGCGGKVFYDSLPSLRYRQHDGNVVGMNATWSARFKRIRMLWEGHFKNWNDSHIADLYKLQHKLTMQNVETLERFAKARQMSLIPRLIHLKRSGIYRQTLLGNLGLIVAAVLGRI
ncbi:glycosyltransferase family 2 protein, partial [Escherichia coli]